MATQAAVDRAADSVAVVCWGMLASTFAADSHAVVVSVDAEAAAKQVVLDGSKVDWTTAAIYSLVC